MEKDRDDIRGTVLLICRDVTFMVNASADNLSAAGYETILAAPTINDLDSHRKDSQMVVF